MKHRVLKFVCTLWLALGLPSVAGADSFVYPEDSRPSSLMPFFADDMSSVRLVELVFDPLVIINKRGDSEGALAQSWKADPGNTGIRFVLREGVRWHDGKPFTADDVVFTVKAAQNPKTIFNAKSKFGFITSVTAEGKYGVHFKFARAVPDPELRFRFKIIPKHKFTKTAIKRRDRFGRKPVGTGPYKLTKWALRNITLTANDGHWTRPKVPEIKMQHTPDKAAQVSLLQYSGGRAGVQAVIFIPPRNLPLFENNDSVVLEPYHTVSWWYLAYNHKNRALADPVVREAIATALDREELLEAHLGRGDLLSGPFTESSPFYNFEVEPRMQDLRRANQMLEEAGYKKRGGVRRKGKSVLKFTIVMDKELPSSQALFLGIEAQLKRVGIKAVRKYLDHAAYREAVFTRKKFDMTVNVWSFEEVEDVHPLFHSKGIMNFISYSNVEVDGILDAARQTRDYKQFKEKMKRLHAVLNTDLPYLFLWSLDIYSGISKRVRSVFIQPYYYFTFFPEWELAP